ncbi:hypothetical protein [Candidatus Protochlamydia phocaeensis]|uniref:hypothetical protein n=1 Tax=Candidatus Protochlamydia phocaeensis TaxID=1414722 RepID=UPI00083955AB|nr:hypothetical protein [Candidatus Protochlamydia phocaeensis]
MRNSLSKILAFILPIILFFFVPFTLKATDLPEELYVRERWLSWTTTFDIESRTHVLGTVHRRFFSLMPEYHLKNQEEQLLAKARMRFWSFGAVFDIVDHQSIPIGSVEEEFAWFFPSFKILAPSGLKLAEATLNFWRTTYILTDPFDGHTIAVIWRSFFRFKNNWTVKIVDPSAFGEKGIHPHMFLTLMAFQVDREYWESIRNSASQQVPLFNVFAYSNYGEFKEKLEDYRAALAGIEPTPDDFLFIESITDFSSLIGNRDDKEEAISLYLSQLLDLLESDQLNPQQKAALFLMLEEKFKELK